MRVTIQATPAYELSIDLHTSAHGHSLRLISFVPTARRPEQQVKFQGLFSTAELGLLRDALSQALELELAQAQAPAPAPVRDAAPAEVTRSASPVR